MEPILDPSTSSARTRAIGLALTQPNYSAQGAIDQAKVASLSGPGVGSEVAGSATGLYRFDDFDRDLERHNGGDSSRRKKSWEIGGGAVVNRDRLRRLVAEKQIKNVAYIAIGGFVFVSIIAWFELLRTFYDNVFEVSDFEDRFGPTFRRLGFAIFATGISIIIIVAIYRNIIQE